MLTHKGTQTIETERLILRRFVAADAEAMLRNWASDPRVTEFLTWLPHESLEVTQRIIALWMDSYTLQDFYQWAIVLRDIDEPIGTISVVRHKDDIASAEIGYCIGSAFWHRGIMTEALGAVIRFLFREVGFNRIEAKHDTDNPHSGDVMRKCGMQCEGTARQADRNNRGIVNVTRYAILRADLFNH